MNTAFGKTLKRLRERAKLTQAELAGRSGIHSQTISNFERGEETNPSLSALFALAKALKVSPAKLVGG